ncbi:MAG: AAA family ATPase [Thermoguttaceae bacterium]|nr:AAA family ATPase [Thermoguttaceae bacterium]
MFKRTTVLTSQTPFHYFSFEDGFYPTKATEAALKSLVRCVRRREGTAIILGATGTGKSLLCTMLANALVNDMYAITINNTNGCTPKALYQSILFELERPYLGLDENEMRLSVLDILTDPARYPAGLALIIDEAHNLPQETLEEIRQLSNGRTRRASGLSVVLSGDLRLEENLSHPRLESFQQRISTRVCLDPWSKKEVASYIAARLKAFKDKVPPKSVDRIRKFSVEACDAVYTATGGVQRLVSQLCDQAYLAAVEQKRLVIEADFIQSVWAQMQSLPDPTQSSVSENSNNESCIEFGSLDDDSDWKSSDGDWKSAGDVDDDALADADDKSVMTDEEYYNSDPIVNAVFGQQNKTPGMTPKAVSAKKDNKSKEPKKASKKEDNIDRFAVNFDDLDKAQSLINELLPSADRETTKEEQRQPTPVEDSDNQLDRTINRAKSIIERLDQLEEYFTSYNTVDYLDPPINASDNADETADQPDDSFEMEARYEDPFAESFQQEEAVRRDDAHPIPPSPFAKNHEGTVSSESSRPKNKGVY